MTPKEFLETKLASFLKQREILAEDQRNLHAWVTTSEKERLKKVDQGFELTEKKLTLEDKIRQLEQVMAFCQNDRDYDFT